MSEEIKKDPSKKKLDGPKLRPLAKGWVDDYRFAESVFVDEAPAFLVIDIRTCEISVENKFGTRFRPLERHECGYKLYSYTSEEIRTLRSTVISIQEIVRDCLRMVQRYLAAPHLDQILVAGEIVLTYCQEWISTVHFPFFVGETESGKTTALYLAMELAYRCMMSSGMSAANIYSFLGTEEEGAGTICNDEAQDVDRDRDVVRIYKVSYYRGSRVARVVLTSKGRSQEFFHTFCCKWFAGENVPRDKALRERFVIVHMLGGKPERNLKRATDEERMEFEALRKKMLFWKLQSMAAGLYRSESGLTGRDQEMWEDFLSLLKNAGCERDAKSIAEHYLSQKRQTDESVESAILRILIPLITKQPEIGFEYAWEFVTSKEGLSGRRDDRSKNTFYSDEFDRITKNSFSDILQFKFHATKIVRYEMVDGKRKQVTYYRFDMETVKTLSEKYHIDSP